MTSVSVLQNAGSAALKMAPFPHMVIEPALPEDLSLVETLTYGTNKVLLFLNTAISFHGVSPRPASTNNRRYVNIMAEVSKRRDLLLRRKKPWFRMA